MQRNEELLGLITRHQRPLLHYISRLVPRDTDAEEVLQEVNLVIWRRADEYRSGTDFAAWVFKIASLQVMAFRQKKARDRLQFSDELIAQLATGDPLSLPSVDRRREALQHCLEQLDKGDLELIASRYEAEEDVSTLAQKVGRSIKAVYRALARVHWALLQCVQRRLAEDQA
jgi:RNA polymerase sigma-70 factor (ECF subfamily)